ncbi:hypothetical protein FB451DRAFT_1289233 [Mycena latifolia]|nr:hypothetical protein FB451DRAFT_1289233 [Mycena latifolia]
MSSEATPVAAEPHATDITPLLPLRSMTVAEFVSWIRGSSTDVQSALITDICWWAVSQTLLKHQFLVFHFKHLGTTYKLTLERAGKIIWNPARLAIDKATLALATSGHDTVFEEAHYLMFALLTDQDIASLRAYGFDAFVDFLDHKWRGPPPTLLDLVHYADTIAAQETRYSIASANCYWFARTLFHTLALRHYSFPIIASDSKPRTYVLLPEDFGPAAMATDGAYSIPDADWQHHDPSSSGLVFRFLTSQEVRTGRLMYRRINLGLAALFCVAIFLAPMIPLFTSRTLMKLRGVPARTRVGLIIGLVVFAVLAGFILFNLVNVFWNFNRVADNMLLRIVRPQTAKTLAMFDAGKDPEAIRGEYIPANIPVRGRTIGRPWPFPLSGFQRVTGYIPQTARAMPVQWTHEKQIYAERRDEYLAAFVAIQSPALIPTT